MNAKGERGEFGGLYAITSSNDWHESRRILQKTWQILTICTAFEKAQSQNLHDWGRTTYAHEGRQDSMHTCKAKQHAFLAGGHLFVLRRQHNTHAHDRGKHAYLAGGHLFVQQSVHARPIKLGVHQVAGLMQLQAWVKAKKSD